ncbi:MAG: arsenate reductase ArsC [Ardenticatenales bacterium]|nr:arsenate reductase ArsC [Ardenticatenales bacterium]
MSENINLRVLVICAGNSARSPMAEGLFRTLGAGRVSVASSGSDPAAGVHPLAVKAMHEIGIDLSEHEPKSIDSVLDHAFDHVIAVCSQAAESCPIFPGPAERLDWFYDDPAAVLGSQEEQLTAFRTVRDGLRCQIAAWLMEHFA